ncbi:Fic family protein [Malacoplasma iowae]|uniref:Uncharacterized protein n=2 Tax=Malacoplasma iowae TaxID=2116 RepID=A0A084U440_MALIO|nr:hypothetical protein [Malacoplasma iowae]VEU61679.1 Uncharacterised protein [Mycoplasmopsis fermentans]EGZ31005.1 hypothetical protein GUU_04089 [Malacoplasma iowae 695]KFB07726.1 hypothetical protein P271_583 [Malacoplasma iowae DK-CPA]QHG90179.1 hypothetical protein EER00_04825 [Malacoplasma iowae 695]WPL36072.1 hypothetical protein QX180_01475 [Malacoplasma iowae]
MSDSYHSKSVYLINNKQLYSICGELFTYLTELRINYSSIDYHHLAWHLSHIIEIVYSNKLVNVDLNIFDVIKQYTNGQESINDTEKYIDANLITTIVASDIRKNNEKISYKTIDEIREWLYKSEAYKIKKQKYNKNEYLLLDLKKYEALINGTSTNNPLFFIGIFLYNIETLLEKDSLLPIERSIHLNLYLMKNKLSFSPTLCISYPLLYNLKNYENALKKLLVDDSQISAFSEIIFDLIKQSAVINRALISNVIYDFSNFKNFLNKRNKVAKMLKNLPYMNLFKVASLSVNVIDKVLKIKNLKESKLILDTLIEQNLLASISSKNDYFMWKQTYHSIKKLDRNKSQSTMEIFKLKEDTN